MTERERRAESKPKACCMRQGTYHRIVDVCRPNAREKQKTDMRKVMAWHNKESEDIGAGLQNSVYWVESN